MRMGFAAWEENTLLAMLDAVSNVYQFRTDDNNAIFPIEAIKIVDISWERSKSHPTFPSLSISRCPSHTVGNLFIASIWYIQRKRCAQRISHVDSSNMHFVLRLCVQLCGCGRANHSVNGSNNCSAFRFASAWRLESIRCGITLTWGKLKMTIEPGSVNLPGTGSCHFVCADGQT